MYYRKMCSVFLHTLKYISFQVHIINVHNAHFEDKEININNIVMFLTVQVMTRSPTLPPPPPTCSGYRSGRIETVQKMSAKAKSDNS